MSGRQMVIKWFNAIVRKPFTILRSMYFNMRGKHEDLAITRLDICNRCSEKINIKFVGDVCNTCGCILDNKTRLEDEHCDLCKW